MLHWQAAVAVLMLLQVYIGWLWEAYLAHLLRVKLHLVCVLAACTTPPTNPLNGVYNCPTNSLVGSTCTGVCNTNFIGSPKVTCGADGAWSSTTGNCTQGARHGLEGAGRLIDD